MKGKEMKKQKLAIVFGSLPTADEVDQFQLLTETFRVSVVSTQSVCGYLKETSRFEHLECLSLPDHDDNPTYIPGLENVLSGFDVVVVKERLGLYAYQAVKAKWKHKFRLIVWADNLAPLPAEDVPQMRTIRQEVINAADAFLVQTQAAAETLKVEGIEAERILFVPPYVAKITKRNKKNRTQALAALGLTDEHTVIAHIGQIEWEEGLIDLAAGLRLALDKDRKKAESIRLVFCGIGSFATQFKQTLIAMGIDDKVIFVAPSRDAHQTILTCADAVYLASTPSRDRVEGDPFRLLSAMVNEVAIICNRTPLSDETCGKNRVDICLSSPSSIADALGKLVRSKATIQSAVAANHSLAKKEFSEKKVKSLFTTGLKRIVAEPATIDGASVDHQVIEAESLVGSKQYLKAIDLIESIFKIDDIAVHHSANLYRLIGDCFAKLSDNESAKSAYIKAIELDGFNFKAFIGLGTVALVKQSNDLAVLNFQKAVSLAPEDEMANLGLGIAFQGLGELDEAHKWVMKSISVSPYSTVAIYTLVRLSYERSNFNDAETVINRYLKRHSNDYNMAFAQGGILFKMGRFKEVVKLMKEITKVDPLDQKALNLLSQAQRALEASKTKHA